MVRSALVMRNGIVLWNLLKEFVWKVYIVISDFMDVHDIRSERVLSSIYIIDARSLGIELTIHIVFVPRVSFMHVLILVVCHSCFCIYFVRMPCACNVE